MRDLSFSNSLFKDLPWTNSQTGVQRRMYKGIL